MFPTASGHIFARSQSSAAAGTMDAASTSVRPAELSLAVLASTASWTVAGTAWVPPARTSVT